MLPDTPLTENARATSSETIVIAERSRLLLRDVDENPAADVGDGELWT